MTRRRSLMARAESGGRLPVVYQEVEYLESTGTQWINTGFNPTNNTRLLARFYCASNRVCPLGARWTGAKTYDTFGIYLGTAGINPTAIYYGRYSSGKYASFPSPAGVVSDVDINITFITLNTSSVNIT